MTTITTVTLGGQNTWAEHDANLTRDIRDPGDTYTIVASDNRSTLEFDSATLVTLPVAATLLGSLECADFSVTIKNVSPSDLVIFTADNIDSETGFVSIPCSNQAYTLQIDQAGTDWDIKCNDIADYNISKTTLTGYISSVAYNSFKCGGFGTVVSNSPEHVMFPVSFSGRVRGLYVDVNGSTLTNAGNNAALTVTIWKYGDTYYQNMQFIEGINATGQGSDTANSFDVEDGDLIYIAFDTSNATSGSVTNVRYTIDIVGAT